MIQNNRCLIMNLDATFNATAVKKNATGVVT